MDVWTDKPHLKIAGVILLAVLVSSCAPQQVLVVGDPYIDALHSGVWAPSSAWFAFKARLRGNKITNINADQDNPLSAVLESSGPADVIILSPWNAVTSDRLPAMDTRFIVAGATPVENLNTNTTFISADRSAVISEIAVLSAGIASRTGTNALAILNTTTSIGASEKQLLIDGFQTAADESEIAMELLIRDIADESTGQLPSDFKTLAAESSVLLLLAGPFNLIALSESGESAVPVITENLGPSAAWSDRIIASIEDNPKAMIGVLMSQLNSEAPEEQQYYPAILVKGVLFGSQSR